MIRFNLTILLSILSCLSLCAQERDFLSIYKQISETLSFEDYDKATILFDSIRKDKNDFTSADLLWFSLIQAKIIQKTKSEKDAGNLLFENLNAIEELKDKKLLIEYNILIGDVTNQNGIPYLEKAIKLCANNNHKALAQANYHLARAHGKTKEGDEKCFKFYNESLRHSLKIGDDYGIAKIYNNLAAKYIQKENFEKGLLYIDSSLYIRKKIEDNFFLASGLINKSVIEIQYNKDESKYLKTLLEAKKLVENSNNFSMLYDLHINLGDAYERKGDFEAATNSLFSALQYGEQLQKSFRDKDLLQSVAQYEASLLKEELSVAESISQMKSKEATLFKWIIFLGLLIFGFMTYILVKNFRLQRKNLELDISKNKIVAEQKLQKLKVEKQNEILNASLDSREEERQNISEILHNSVSALLSSANMHLKVLKKKNNLPASNEYEKTQSLIMDASDQVRALSHQLTSPRLQNFGLSFAISDLAEKYSNEQLKFTVDFIEINPRPLHEVEIKIFRTIEELCNNIMKHSQANLAKITGKFEHNYLVVKVTDNGIGFSNDDLRRSNSLGLTQIKSVVEFVNGTFDLDFNNGTSVTLKFPKEMLYDINSRK